MPRDNTRRPVTTITVPRVVVLGRGASVACSPSEQSAYHTDTNGLNLCSDLGTRYISDMLLFFSRRPKQENHKPDASQMKTDLKQTKWSAPDRSGFVMETAVSSLSMTASIRQEERLGPGKTGLVNLGNTCYMNSVVQALYMCDQFRRGVLEKIPDRKETLLMKLQHVFAHLSHSNRPAISPSKFLQTSRAPWFVPGHQQDCSEFLRHLLNELHEEEKWSPLPYLEMRSSHATAPPTESTKGHANTLNTFKITHISMTPLKAVKTKTEKKTASLKLLNNHSLPKNSAKSLVERIFRGQVQTSLRCVACNHTSLTVESFTDISLAFPNSPISWLDFNKTLAGGGGTPGLDTQIESVINTESETAANSSLESFSLDDLISYYLKPEKLSGDNKYHCGKCRKLQDGERRIQIIESPQYIIFTLLRFSYDTILQARTKIFHNVLYPQTLLLPVCNTPFSKNQTPNFSNHTSGNNNYINHSSVATATVYSTTTKLKNISNKLEAKCENCDDSHSKLPYGLCGVIIHSGSSSENGHYYCYARHSQTGQINVEMLDNLKGSLDDVDFLPDQWCSFNDKDVSSVTFESFRDVTKRFSKDTPYVLIYRRLNLGGPSCDFENDEVLPPHLIDEVMKDNEAYLKEQEAATRTQENRRRRSSSSNSVNFETWSGKPDNDDDDVDKDLLSPGVRLGFWEGIGSGLDVSGSRYMF